MKTSTITWDNSTHFSKIFKGQVFAKNGKVIG